jgi:plasmid stabilization system protein ParE
MKVVLTDEALRDLDEIVDFIATNYPTISKAFEERLHAVFGRIGMWPHSAQEVADRPGVRAAPLIRYPYKVFYRVTENVIEVLHIHHGARRAPSEEDH